MKRITIAVALLLAASSLKAGTCRILSWDERSVTVEFASAEPDITLSLIHISEPTRPY